MSASLHRRAEASDANRATLVIQRRAARQGAGAYFFLLLATVVLTPLLILVGYDQGYGEVLAIIAALIALIFVPWKPIFGLYLIVISAVVIEQEPLIATPIGTDHLNIFYWPPKLQGLPERPIGFYILAVLLITIGARLLFRRRLLLGGRLFYPFLFFLGCIAFGVLYGLATGGDFRIIVLEIRPWWYLFITYILAYNIVTEVKHIRALIWITVLGTAIKGVQGVYIVQTYLGGAFDGHNEIMAHEQSYFFVLVLLLLVMMFLLRFQRGIFITILLALPCLLLALYANNRRADYVALLIGIGVAWTMAIVLKPDSRRRLIPILVICLILGAGYVVAFQNSSGALGEPARAVVSIFNPDSSDERDAASNAYRIIENYDLRYTASQSPLLGWGFGKPFLQPIVLPNVVDLDPYYLYIPDTNVIWMWKRLGPVGFAALWYLIGSAVVSGCLIARQLKNQELRFFAVFAIAALVMEVILAYGDYQFFFYRNMIFVGVILGVLMKLPAIEHASLGKPGEWDGDLTASAPQKPSRLAPRLRARGPLPLPAAMARAGRPGSSQGEWKYP